LIIVSGRGGNGDEGADDDEVQGDLDHADHQGELSVALVRPAVVGSPRPGHPARSRLVMGRCG
jgi:hypothetical protein